MARSLKKGPFVDLHLRKKIDQMNAASDRKVVKTWSRRSTIIPEMVGLTIAVHNGTKFIPIYISENINLTTYRAYCTIRGGEVLSGN